MVVTKKVVTLGGEQQPTMVVRKEVEVRPQAVIIETEEREDLDWSAARLSRRAIRISGQTDLTNLNKKLRGTKPSTPSSSGVGITSRGPSA